MKKIKTQNWRTVSNGCPATQTDENKAVQKTQVTCKIQV